MQNQTRNAAARADAPPLGSPPDNLLADIESLADLKDGWDGPGSLAPTSKTREAAKAILRATYSAYSFPASTIEVLPDPEGTIFLFYYGYPEGDEISSGMN